MKRSYILSLLSICLVSQVSAQAGLKDLLQKVQAAYHRPAHLSFRVSYAYANDNQPDHPVDTLSGVFYMDKGMSRFDIPGTTSLVTDTYAVQVITEDKLMYISKTPTASPINPAASLDTLMHHLDRVQATVSGEGRSELLTLAFPPGQPYTRVQMTIDTATGYIWKMTYDLYTAGFVASDQVDRPGHEGPYQAKGTITVLFAQYQNGGFGDEVFDAGHYFARVGNEFHCTGPYKDYHIFLASSHY